VNLAKPKCWLVDDYPERNHLATCTRIARLRGLEIESCPAEGAVLPSLVPARNQLIAVDFEALARMTEGMRHRLREWTEHGATVYVRGALREGRVYSLKPFSNQCFEFTLKPSAGYEFSKHWMLPAAMVGERVAAPMKMPHAAGLDPSVRKLMSGTDAYGDSWPVIFEMSIGAGVVIFDLHADDHNIESELLTELEEPTTRGASIGALAAVDWAAGRDPDARAAVNLVIDDRPVNFDYFSLGKLKEFLEYLRTQHSDFHVDLAWTPTHTRPDRRYINLLRRYNTGFVWHGFLRHIDHRLIADCEAELQAGIARVDSISRAYHVRFQPVMIFPFEKDTPRARELLRRTEFIATVMCDSGINQTPNFYRLRALQDERSTHSSLSIIFRDSTGNLSRDRMLALATLGMPIIALAHPGNLALRRFSRRDSSAAAYFDPVLKFAAEKSLRSRSLEEIAAEVPCD
jgi:hypothetical protein